MSDAIREAFEKWYISEYGTLGDGVKFHGKFGYPDIVVDTAWHAWQAALIANGGEAAPYAYGVIRQDGEIDFSVTVHPDRLPMSGNWATDCCHAHINDAVRAGIEGAKKWVVRPLYTHSAPPSVAAPEGWRVTVEDGDSYLVSSPADNHCIVRRELRAPDHYLPNIIYDLLSAMLTAAPQPDHSPDAGKVVPEGPIPALLYCPECGELHVDEYEWAKRPHKTHQCQSCGCEWRPFSVATVGIDPFPAPATDAGKVGARYALVTYNNGELHKPRDFWIEDTRTGERLYKGPSSFEAVNRESGELIVAALNSATPSVPEEEIASKAIAQFKDELVNSVKPIFRPHIEGVCAVVIDRLRTAGDDGEGK